MGKKIFILALALLMCLAGTGYVLAADDAFVINTKREDSETDTLKITIQYPELVGLDNAVVQDKLNSLFAELASDAKNRAKEAEKNIIPEQIAWGIKAECYFTYEVKYNHQDLLSIVFSDYQYGGGAHGLTIQSSYTFDLKTGTEYKLKDLFKAGSDYVSLISSEVKKQMEERDMTEFLLYPFHSIKTDQDFYLSDNAVTVYFQAYEYLAYAYGIPEFTVEFSILEEWLNLPVTAGNTPYAFTVRGKSDQTMRVQFKGNKMYHQDRYVGFGVSGKPMLSLRYMAEYFGFQVDYDPASGSSLVKKGEYSFRLKPGRSQTEIFWAGEKVKEFELTAKPLLKNNVMYVYSLDLRELLGLFTYWNNDARIWDVLYREYTCEDPVFPAIISGDLLLLKGLLIDDGRHNMPVLEVLHPSNGIQPSHSSVSLLEQGGDSGHLYEMNSELKLQEGKNRLQIMLMMGQRIIFARNLEVMANIEAKELVVEPPYRLTSPTQGYVKTTQPQVMISGSVEAVNNYYPSEVVLFVKKAADKQVLLQESVPVIDGLFKRELALQNGEGLYYITVNSVMAGPHGPAYPEITNFYVEYGRW